MRLGTIRPFASLWTSPEGSVPKGEIVLLSLILLYGGLVRLEALHQAYPPPGTTSPPLAEAESRAAALVSPLSPVGDAVERGRYPYREDPKSYLDSARAMSHLYEARLREPFFVLATKLSLGLLGGQDRAVSLASTLASILILIPVYFIGRMLGGPPVALTAAALIAVEPDLIRHAPLGLRAETFALTLLLFAWAALACLRSSRRRGHAFVLGATGAAACLTRITALSFVAPTLLWLFFTRRTRGSGRKPLVALLLVAVLVAPYLVTCWLEFGDPLYSLNWHTDYYRQRSEMVVGAPDNAAELLAGQIRNAPVRTADTVFRGLTQFPWSNKFAGFESLIGEIPTRALQLLALAGLAVWVWSPSGRLLLLTLVSSMLPFAFTWEAYGGAPWRFTLHAQPYFLLAASHATVLLGRFGAEAFRGRLDRHRLKPVVIRGTLSLTGVALLVAATSAVPAMLVLTDLARDQPTSIAAGWRDELFFDHTWHPRQLRGEVTYRDSRGSTASVWFPLLQARPLSALIRLDTIPEAQGARLRLQINGTRVGTFDVEADPQAVDSYRFDIPADVLHRGGNRLDLRVTSRGRRADDPRISFWYVRLYPR